MSRKGERTSNLENVSESIDLSDFPLNIQHEQSKSYMALG